MSDDRKGAGRGKGFNGRDIVLLAAALAIAVAAGFGVDYYLEQKRRELAAAEEQARSAERMFIDAGDADLVFEGREVYEANCADCHGFKLEGQPDWRQRGPDGILPAPPHDETGHSWHHPDQMLFAIVKMGGQAMMPAGVTSGMPAYKDDLSDREIEAALAYIKSRWPDDIRRGQEIRTMQSR